MGRRMGSVDAVIAGCSRVEVTRQATAVTAALALPTHTL